MEYSLLNKVYYSQLLKIFKKASLICLVISLTSARVLFGQAVTVNSTQLSGGLSGTPVTSNATNQAIFGFTLDKAGGGTNTVTSITVNFTQDPSVRYASAALYLSTNNSSYDGSDTNVSTGTINATNIVFTGAPLTNFGNGSGSVSRNFFVVVTVAPGVTTATTASTPSVTGANVVVGDATTPTGTVTGTAYAYTTDATVTGTGTTRNIVGGDAAATLSTFNVVSSGNAEVLSQIDYVFSTDITGKLSNFVLFDGTANTAGTYTAGTKTVSFTLNKTISSSINYTLKGDVATGVTASSPTVSLSTSGVTVSGGTINTVTTITNTLSITGLAATVAGTGTSRALVGGDAGATLATFTGVSTGNSNVQSVSQLDFVFSVDIAAIFNTSNFVLFDGTANVGTPTYTAGTKTLSFTGIAESLNTTPVNFTLKGDVLSSAATSSPTVSLSTSGVTIAGGGTLNSVTTITNTLNVTAVAATVAGTGTSRALVGGDAGATLATFTGVSTGTNVQSISQLDFVFSADISAVFNTSNFVLFDGTANVGTASYTAGTKTLSFTGLTEQLNTTPTNFTLKGDVLTTTSTTSPTVSLSTSGVTITGAGTLNAVTTITNTLNVTALKATVAGTGSARALIASNSGATLATFTGASTGTNVQSITQLDFVFSVDIATVFNTSNFVLFDGTANVGTPTYTAGTKTLSFTGLTEQLNTTPINFTLKGDVLSTAGSSSQTVALSTSGVTIAGGGTLNAVTTITNTLNVTALTATVAGTGTSRSLTGGNTGATLATFTGASTGTNVQSVSQLDFVFSVDIATIFNTSNFVLFDGSGNVGTPTYTAGTKTLSFTGISKQLNTTPVNFTLKGDVLSTASATSLTVDLANSGVTITGGGTLNTVTTITNTLNVTALSATLTAIVSPAAPLVGSLTLESGQTTQALVGFSVSSPGTQQITAINFNVSGLGAQLSNIKLYKSASAGTIGSSIATSATGNFTGLTQNVSSTVYYYLVADVATGLTTAAASVTVAPTEANITFSTGGKNTMSISQVFGFTQSFKSSIVANGGTSTSITPIGNQAASGLTTSNSASLGTFTVKDGGASNNDTDVLPTTLTNLSFTITGTGATDVRAVGIFVGASTTSAAELSYTAGTYSFSSLNIQAVSGGNQNFTIRASFNASVTDGDALTVNITAASASSAGSLFGASINPTANDAIDVVATKTAFSAAPTGAKTGTNFSFTVSAVDALGNVDTGRNGSLTLTKDVSSSSGVLSSASNPTLIHNLSGGTYTWTDLQFSSPGNYQLDAAYTGLTTGKSTTFAVASSGVSVTKANDINVCVGLGFQAVSNIHIQEQFNTDFGAGTSQYFYLELPTDWIFDTSITTKPTFTAGRDLSNMSNLSYIGNTIVRFKYDISGTTAIDDFTITGLMIKYTGTVVSSGTIQVLDGSATVLGDAENDNVNHGNLTTSVASNVGYTFDASIPGQTIPPNQTVFPTSVTQVVLSDDPSNPLPALTNKQFSGTGVVFSPSANAFVFNPSLVGFGNYNITYTGTNASGCTITVQRQFVVANSAIQNLSNKYCNNDPQVLNMVVPASSYDIAASYTPYSATTVYSYYTYVSFAGGVYYLNYPYIGIVGIPPSNSTYWVPYAQYTLSTTDFNVQPTGTTAFQNQFFTQLDSDGLGNITFTLANHGYSNGDQLQFYFYVYDYNTGTYPIIETSYPILAISSVTTNTFKITNYKPGGVAPIAGSWTQYYNGLTNTYMYSYGYKIVPQNPSGATLFNAGTPSAYFTVNFPGHGLKTLSQSYKVRVQFTGYNDPHGQYNGQGFLYGFYTISNITANSFDIAVPDATTASYCCGAFYYLDVQNYRLPYNAEPVDFANLNSNLGTYTGVSIGFYVNNTFYPSNGEQNYGGVSVQLLTPTPVNFAGLSPNYCVNALPVTLTSVGGLDGAFSSVAGGITDNGAGPTTGTFNPASVTPETQIDIVLNYTDGSGCKSSATQSTFVRNLPTVNAGASIPICNGTSTTLGATPTASGHGPFTYLWNNALSLSDATAANPIATPSTLTTYTATVTDFYACQNTAQITITPNTPAVVNPPNGVYICQGNTLAMSLTSPTIGGSASTAKWSTAADPLGQTDFSSNTGTFASAIYTPTASDIAAGSVKMTLTSDDPAGPCPVATNTVIINVNRKAVVFAAPVLASRPLSATYCANGTITLQGNYTGSTNTITWDAGTGGGTFSPNANSPLANYIPSATELSNGANLTFTITSNDPDGSGPTGPCPAATEQITIKLDQPATAIIGSGLTICGTTGVTFNTSSLLPSTGGSAAAAHWNVVSGIGTFTSTPAINNSVFKPHATDITNGSVTLQLQADPPPGSTCSSDFKNVTIPINPAATVGAGSAKYFCSSSNVITLDRDAQGTPDPSSGTGALFYAGATSVNWQHTSSGTNTNINNSNALSATYTLTPTEQANGAVLSFDLITNDPDDFTSSGGSDGPCLPAKSTVIITINQKPVLTLGSGIPTQICADLTIALNANYSGSASNATWTTSNAAGTISPGSFGTPLSNSGTANTVYTPSNGTSSTELENPNQQNLFFTVTTDDPDGPAGVVGSTYMGPCSAASANVAVQVNPIPNAPTLSHPAGFSYPIVPNFQQQKEWCTGDIIPANSYSASGVLSGSQVNWYSDSGLTNKITANSPTFSPPIATSIDGKATYYITQVTSFGCESKGQFTAVDATPFTVNVYPRPVLQFTVDKICEGDLATYDASASDIAKIQFPSSSITYFGWDFADGTAAPINTAAGLQATISNHLQLFGTHDVVVKAVSDQNCFSSIQSSLIPAPIKVNPNLPVSSAVIVGPYPTPQIDVIKQCLNDATQFTGTDLSTNPNKDQNTWLWDFGDASSPQTSASITTPGTTFGTTVKNYAYASIGVYPSKLSITTNRGCTRSLVRNVPILPYLSSAVDFPYVESFEAGNGGWIPDGFYQDPTNQTATAGYSWGLGAPSTFNTVNITTASQGTNAWITNSNGAFTNFGTSYYPNERSVLYGPCVDVTKLQRPVFSVDYWDNTEVGNDGVSVEVSENDGASWQVLGKVKRGLNWYDKANISGLSINPSITTFSGQQIGQAIGQIGFTGVSYDSIANTGSGWVTGKFQLDAYATDTRLRVRFMFGTNGNDPDVYDGFALDNIHIENRNRIILAENFTNEAAPNSATNISDFNAFQSPVIDSEIVKVEYHTTFGNSPTTGTDAFNKLNPSDPASRASFYGVTRPFKGYLDGYSKDIVNNPAANGQIDPVLTNWAFEDFDSRSLATSPVDITNINPVLSGSGVDITATITATQDLNVKGKYVVQMAVVEQLWTGSSLLRRFLPNAAGTVLTVANKNDTQTLTPLHWELDKQVGVDTAHAVKPGNLWVIVFVQDLQNKKEVLQSSTRVKIPAPPVVTSVEQWEQYISVYPNPSDNEFNVKLPAPAPFAMKVVLSDQMGKTIHSGAFANGEQSKTISTQGLSDGMYILQIGDDGNAVRKKVMVIHK